jgi:uncharacterized membrane protein
MAKKTTQRRPARTSESMPEETPVSQGAFPEPPTAAPRDIEVQYRRDDAAPPSRWRDRILIFVLTLVAMLIGIAIGFYFGQRTTQSAQPATQAIAESAPVQRDREASRKVLVMLQDELVENARVLKQRRESGYQALVNPAVSSQTLKNDVWKAVFNSNRIPEAADLDLLKTLMDAYRQIEEIRVLDTKRFEIMTASGRSPASGRESAQLVASELARISPMAEKSIVEAAVQMERKITANQ